MVYPEGLNGGLEPVVTSLPESLAHSVSMLDKPTFLVVDLSHVTSGDQVPEDSAPHRTSTPTSPTHLTMEHPPKAESHISMTAEVQELLSCAVLDTSSQESGGSTPKSPTSTALGAPPSPRAEDSSKLVATSSQALPWAATPDDTEPFDQTPDKACAPTTLPARAPGTDRSMLPENVIILQNEMNKVMGCLLTTRSFLDAC